jgi:hypothetical protein
MPSTYTLIKGETLTSSAASYTFTAIPSTFTDLVLRVSARSDTSAQTQQVWLQFNSDTSALYSYLNLGGNGSVVQGNIGSSLTSTRTIGGANGNTSTTSTFGNSEIYIPSYTVSQNKPIGSFGVSESNATAATMAVNAGLWRNTAAITSITILPSTSLNWLSGSSFYLYGIKNS